MTPEEIEAVAKKLTKAQREVIAKIGDPKRPFGGMWRTGLCTAQDYDLKDRGIVRWSIPAGTLAPMCILTPLGLALRAHLQSQGTQP